jgi:hypothetical protein
MVPPFVHGAGQRQGLVEPPKANSPAPLSTPSEVTEPELCRQRGPWIHPLQTKDRQGGVELPNTTHGGVWTPKVRRIHFDIAVEGG